MACGTFATYAKATLLEQERATQALQVRKSRKPCRHGQSCLDDARGIRTRWSLLRQVGLYPWVSRRRMVLKTGQEVLG